MLLELQRRLKAANDRINVDFLLPLTSTHVAHVLSLPVVHVSRTISAMNRSNLIGESYGAVQTLDRQRLMRLSQFDGDYLA